MTPKPAAVVAVIPARNEVRDLPDTIVALREMTPGIEVLVVDDASTDGTEEAASGAGASVMRAAGADGKGGAMLAGLSRARAHYPPETVLLLCDADLGVSAANLAPLIEAVTSGAGLAVAAFPSSVAKGGGFGAVKRFARARIEARSGFSPVEPLSGQRAMRASALRLLPGLAPGFGAEVGMTLDFLDAGVTPLEIPVELSHRKTGKSVSGFLHRARQGYDVLRALRGERLRWP